jgi:hypothetical protein
LRHGFVSVVRAGGATAAGHEIDDVVGQKVAARWGRTEGPLSSIVEVVTSHVRRRGLLLSARS